MRRPLLALALAGVGLTAGAGGAARGQYAPASENPCHGPDRAELLCPNLQMSPPRNLSISTTDSHRRLLHATNSINSRGSGPAELRGRRASGEHYMEADQAIHKRGGGVRIVDTPARLGFKHIPGQGGFWKFRNAAVFEIWALDSNDKPVNRVRVGEKQYYCLRDLFRTKAMKASPRDRVYPSCNKDRNATRDTLGTSVGWSDVYPSTYYEQYIDVTGLSGRYGFFHIVDPQNGIWEKSESDNASMTIVSLPSGRVLGTQGPMDRPR